VACLDCSTYLKTILHETFLGSLDELRFGGTAEKEEVKSLRRKVFARIEQEKVDAQNARKEAEKQKNIAQKAQIEAEKQKNIAQKALIESENAKKATDEALKQVEIEKNTAVTAEEKTQEVLDNIFFYDDKFGLATQVDLNITDSRQLKYGFIDRQLKIKIPFIYEEAVSFDEYGFAKVKKNGTYFLIDTFGTEYQLATDRDIVLADDSMVTAIDLRGAYDFARIATIFQSFQHKHIKILIIGGSINKYPNLVDSIATLASLEYLCLNSDIENFPLELCKLIKLKYLNLKGNKIEKIPSQIAQLKNLLHLNLSNNHITKLPIELGNMVNLHYLDLRRLL
jgi:Leucine rich repeat/WG containing repeat